MLEVTKNRFQCATRAMTRGELMKSADHYHDVLGRDGVTRTPTQGMCEKVQLSNCRGILHLSIFTSIRLHQKLPTKFVYPAVAKSRLVKLVDIQPVQELHACPLPTPLIGLAGKVGEVN